MRTKLMACHSFPAVLPVLLGLFFVAIAASDVSSTATADTAQGQPTTPKQDAVAPTKMEPKPQPPTAPPSLGTPAMVVDDSTVQSLLGKDVISATGEKLGQITDIIVGHSGDIRAAVIDFGGFLGVGSRKIAVAWHTLNFSKSGITLEMGRDELRVTPEYHQGEPIVIVGAADGIPPAQRPPSPPPQPPAAAK